MQSYRELIVWQRSIELVEEIYKITKNFPREEIYGLTSQMRRSAISIPSNIAEGYARKHKQEYIQFLRIAFGSGAELETQLEIAMKLEFIKTQDTRRAQGLLGEVMRMLNKLVASLVAKP